MEMKNDLTVTPEYYSKIGCKIAIDKMYRYIVLLVFVRMKMKCNK